MTLNKKQLSKKQCRESALRHREAQTQTQEQAQELTRNLFQALASAKQIPPPALIAGYFPIGSEANLLPALQALSLEGFSLLLPWVPLGESRSSMVFRAWRFAESLTAGPLGTRQPSEESPVGEPRVLLAPLLAFDGRGNRLGYGGGFYDRFIAHARIRPLVLGIAWSCQEVESVPTDAGDQPLDGVVTEKESRMFARNSMGSLL